MHYKSLGPVVLDIGGVELKQEDKELLSHPQVGGIILFSRNYESTAQLQDLVASIRDVRPELIIAVDHEGGRVQRFRDGFTRIPPMQCLGAVFQEKASRGIALAQDIGWLLSAELLRFDIDISFAPVLDVDDSFSDIIGDRSFSSDPNTVVTLCQSFIAGMHEAGMAVTGKHFPGHGGVKQDSHLELPQDTRSMDQLHQRDLLPFVQLLDSLDALMPAHIVFPQIDSLPVGFSEYWLKKQLREQLGYKGLIFSDDLTMEGAASIGSFEDRAELALQAGCDSVLVCNHRPGAEQVVEFLERQQKDYGCMSLDLMRQKYPQAHQELLSSDRWHSTADAIAALS